MATYRYKPYYSYNGPTHSQPFREELPAAVVEKNIEFFFQNLDSHFVGTGAVINHDGEGTAIVLTSMPREESNEIVKGLLNYLDLFAYHSYEP